MEVLSQNKLQVERFKVYGVLGCGVSGLVALYGQHGQRLWWLRVLQSLSG